MLGVLTSNARIQGRMDHPDAPQIPNFKGSWNTVPGKVKHADGSETPVLHRVFTIETRKPDAARGSVTSGFYNCIVKDPEVAAKVEALQWKMVELTGVATFNRETKYLQIEVTSVSEVK